MGFFFGDSTPATFEGHFLEVLRDTTAFAVRIAELDETIVTAEARKAGLVAEAEIETRRLEALGRAVLAAITTAEKGKVTSATARFAAELAGLSTERHRAAGEAVREKLSEEQQAVDDDAAAARERYSVALESYLRLTDPPGGQREITLTLGFDTETDEEHYAADVTGTTPYGLAWCLELLIPVGSPWATPLRVDTFAPALAIEAPQKTGIIKKEVKRKRQKLHRWFVIRAADDGPNVHLSLRPVLGEEIGLDLSIEVAAGTVTATRVGAKDDPSVGSFVVAEGDVAALVLFATNVRDAARDLPRNQMVSATLDGLPFDGTHVDAQPKLVEIVPRLVHALTPTVREIAARSLADDELIVRRTLPDGQREEIFMPRSMLREKIAPLDTAHRAMFLPLGLDPEPVEDLAQARLPAVEVMGPVAPPVRQQSPAELSALAAALPPMRPVLRSRVAAATLPPPPPADVRSASRMPAAGLPNMRPPARTEPLMLTRGKKRASIAPPRPSASPPRPSTSPPRPSTSPPRPSTSPPRPSTVPPRNTELVTTLKEIRAMAKDGRVAESFRQLGQLFSAAAFSACRAEDRRRALRMLVSGKPSTTAQEERNRAHLAAVPALQLLIVEHHDPADYEMLGTAYLELGEPEKASDVWKKALDIERARDPGSDLCGSLMRRVSSL